MGDINPYEPPRAEFAADDNANSLYRRACEAAEGAPYAPEAFVFLVLGFDCVQRYVRHHRKRVGPLHAVDLCWCPHDLAVHRFAAKARSQLASWNIRTTLDFGELMYRLIALGELSRPNGVEKSRSRC